jgi:hypothetical protein
VSSPAGEQPSDLDRLLGAGVEAAVRMLSAEGEFYPFALAVSDDGEVVSPAVQPESDHPSADDVVGLLLEALRAQRATLRAVAVCTNVRLRADDGQERDAIRLELESRAADPLVVVVPYADARLDEPFGAPGERRVFT